MRNPIITSLVLALAFTAIAPQVSAKDMQKTGSSVLLPAGDLKWNEVPGFPGVMMATLEGDPATGPCHFMMRLSDGFAAPLHHHTSDHFVTVVSGTLSLTVDGKETKLPAGSFFLFKGKKVHVTKCEPGADCVLTIDARGKWDVFPETVAK